MKPELVAAIYRQTIILSLLSVLVLPSFSRVAPVYAASAQPAYTVEADPLEVTPKPEARHFFTLDRDALNFLEFAQRGQHSLRRNPHQIIEAIRQKHQDSSQDFPIKEKIQRLQEQLPQQSEQLRRKVSELPKRLKASASRTNISVRRSIEVTATDYLDRQRVPPFLTRFKRNLYRIKRRLEATAISVLEQTSDRLDQTAQRLKE